MSGLSPRGRGNRYTGKVTHRTTRSIPAWAGEPSRAEPTLHKTKVYPRVGGGTAFRASSFSHRSGLSPRGRGNLLRQSPDGFYLGSIPAWAGEPHPAVYVTGESPVYPRVGGGTINDINPLSALGGLSPRGRGNRGGTVQGRPVDRSIPAWAGEPANRLCAAPLDTVYPRVGGGTISWCISIAKRYGLSPRGRGNLIEPAQSLTLRRSIPAWAGEPFARNPQTPRASVYPRVGGGTR